MAEEGNRYTYRLLTVCLFLIYISDRLASRLSTAWREENASIYKIASLIGLCLIVGQWLLTLLILACLPMSSRHTLKTAILSFYAAIFIYLFGWYRWRIADKATKSPRRRQDAFLLNLLRENAETEYGREMNFKQIKNREDFRNLHPLTNYETFRPYVDRMVEGETDLIVRGPIERFGVSSGTTGKCKLIPCTESSHKHVLWNFYLPLIYRTHLLKKDAFISPLKSGLFLLVPKWRYTDKGGIPIGPVSAILEKRRSPPMAWGRTLPLEAEVYLSEPGQCYLHWLFALTDRELCRLDSTFAGSLLGAIDILQKNWELLADDIRFGRVSKVFDIPEDVIANIYANGSIWPDRYRAEQIEEECTKGFQGIIQRLWPRIISISCAVTGSHSIHREKLQWYLGDKIRILSMFIYASEGLIGMNMDEPAQVDGTEDDQFYTLLPDATFMEFVPEDEIGQVEPNTLFMDQLELGKRYEIVVTSIFGVYRYRLGDIVEVRRFRHGATPVVKFCARVGSLLDLIGEKTSEDTIYGALKNCLPKWKGCRGLVDYTTCESVTCGKVFGKMDIGLYYVIFVELDNVSRELGPSEADRFDYELREISYPYKSFRVKQSLAKSRVFVVRKGTFEKMKSMVLERNSAISNQYKTPRYLKNEDCLKLLMALACPNEKAAIDSL